MEPTAAMLLRIADHILQYHEGWLSLRHLDKRHPLAIYDELSWVDSLAQLACKRPIEIGAHWRVWKIQSTTNPMAKAAKMDIFDGAFALARRYQWVLLG
jgi:hypothetical protein